ncbi:protein deadpan-like [Homarus americanus]|uniref:Deadpan-like 2 n=1 Tax=Homarus americanus TaxID=6706 RepID=A0A8J5N3Q9_HOMAM|nr:protein deadpan-like [Homarus americanus]KAG7172670.1 deadpan-like 2 [Homarus americanus]
MPSSTTAKQGVEAKAAAAERRRTNKPIMEKKRRQRINDCLNQLKNLVLEGLKKDPSRYNKLEKADILEMTVRHVQHLHRHESALSRQPPVDAAAKFRAGFGQCAAEVGKFLEQDTTLSGGQRSRILLHLADAMASLRNTKSQTSDVSSSSEPHHAPHPAPIDPLVVRGVSLVPTRLLTGQMAFVLPHGVTGTIASPSGELHHAPPSPPPSAASPSLSLASSPPPSPCRSPSPQPLDLAPIRNPEDECCWRPW